MRYVMSNWGHFYKDADNRYYVNYYLYGTRQIR